MSGRQFRCSFFVSATRVVSAMFALAVLMASAGPVVATDVAAGIDLFQSPPGSSFTDDFNSGAGGNPIPADFFDPGSDPFDGSIGLDGDPFPYSGNGPCLAPADTIVERLTDAPFLGCPEAVDIPIQIVALSLVSTAPITVTYNGGLNPELWDIRACLSDLPQQIGNMTIQHDCPDGGTFFSNLPVLPKFIFTRQSDNAVRIFDAGVQAVPPTLFSTFAGWVHQSTISQVTQVGPGSEVDGNCDGVLEVLPVGTSNFVPGIFPFPCDCTTPPGGSQQQKKLTGEQAMLAAHGVLPAQDPPDDNGNGIPDDCEGTGPKPVESKWTQLPHPPMEGFNVPSDLDWVTLGQQPPGDPGPGPNWVVADDFQSDGRPITCVRWWGSYVDGDFEPPCGIACPPGGIDEAEPNCGVPADFVNGGCNSTPPVYTPIACGDTVCGTAAYDLPVAPGVRDTDWYELVLAADTAVTWSVVAGFDVVIGVVDNGGVPSCVGVNSLLVFSTAGPCTPTSVTVCLPPGVWWLFVAPDFAGPPLACGAEYVGTVTCGPCISKPAESKPDKMEKMSTSARAEATTRGGPRKQDAGPKPWLNTSTVIGGGLTPVGIGIICVDPGLDCWSTECGTSLADLSSTPIPAGFFDPGSLPFEGTIELGGGPGLIDTQIARLDQMCFSDSLPETQTTQIQLVQLDLVGCAPITVQGSGGTEQWDVQVDLAGPQPLGSMTVTKENANGGTFSSDLPVQPRYTFSRVEDPLDTRIFDTFLAGFPPIQMQTIADACWSTDESLEQCSFDGFAAGYCGGGGGGCCKPVCHRAGGDTPHQHCTTPPLCPPCPRDVDGWLVSFHTDLPADQSPDGFSQPLDLLGLYFCPDAAVQEVATGIIGWDGHRVYEYVVELEHCHLLHSYNDPRPGAMPPDPARDIAFCETEDFIYWLDIQAIVGHTYVHGQCDCDCDFNGDGICTVVDLAAFAACIGTPTPPGCDQADFDCDGDVDVDDQTIMACLIGGGTPAQCCPNLGDPLWMEVETQNWAKDHFWGWHTSPDHWNDQSVMGMVVMGPGMEWLYPGWMIVDGSEHLHKCACLGDFDGDMVLTGADIQGFVACVTGNVPAGTICTCADVNMSGSVDSGDIAAFVTKLLQKAPCMNFQPFVDQAFELLTPSQLGACCISPTECVIVSEIECVECRGGIYLGDKEECPTTTVRVVVHTATQWSHSIETVVDCPSPAAGLVGCTDELFEIDPWTTEAGGTSCEDFSHPEACPIPADFFGPGSDPFTGQVCFDGVPLGNTPFGDFGDADTLVLRTQSPFDRCDVSAPFPTPSVDVSIEVVALNLTSVNPIIVTFNGGQNPEAWDVDVSLSDVPAPSFGTLTAIKSHCNGGTYSSSLSVFPKFTFTRVSDQMQIVLDTGLSGCDPIDMGTSGDTWVHDPHPNMGLQNPVCTDFFPGVEDQNPVDQSTCDCNGNGNRDICDVPQSPGCPIGSCTVGCSNDLNEDCVPDECP